MTTILICLFIVSIEIVGWITYAIKFIKENTTRLRDIENKIDKLLEERNN